jgi:small nuclear ribonucleoprotein (snRNP)-like protein
MEKTETVLRNLIGRLIFLRLRDGTRLKGDLIAVEDGVAELHSLKNIHFVEISEIMHATVAKKSRDDFVVVDGSHVAHHRGLPGALPFCTFRGEKK